MLTIEYSIGWHPIAMQRICGVLPSGNI